MIQLIIQLNKSCSEATASRQLEHLCIGLERRFPCSPRAPHGILSGGGLITSPRVSSSLGVFLTGYGYNKLFQESETTKILPE